MGWKYGWNTKKQEIKKGLQIAVNPCCYDGTPGWI